MSDTSRYDERDKEAVGESRRSRWDRSSRDGDRPNQRERGDDDRTHQREPGPGLSNSEQHQRWYGPSTEGNKESFNTTPTTVSGWSSSKSTTTAERPGRRRFAETESAEEGQLHTKSGGETRDNLEENFSDVDLELEEQYRRYEQEQQRLSAGDAESNKRDYAAAFSHSDYEPTVATEEPHAKKSGFTMTMGSSRSGGAAGSTAFAQKAIGFSMSKSKLQPFDNPLASKKPVAPIKMSLGVQKPKAPTTIKKQVAVANVFNEEEDSDEEEMPPEAKMRMRNLGRETPTAAGPNSFGKGNLGFCDRHKIIQRELQKKMDEVGPQK